MEISAPDFSDLKNINYCDTLLSVLKATLGHLTAFSKIIVQKQNHLFYSRQLLQVSLKEHFLRPSVSADMLGCIIVPLLCCGSWPLDFDEILLQHQNLIL